MILLALALQAAAPQPGELRTFQDWTVGCDNGRYCQAVSLVPEGSDDGRSLSVRRNPAADAEPVFSFYRYDDEDLCGAQVSADGRPLPVRILEGPDCTIVHPADVPALLRALRSAAQITVTAADGSDLGRVSLAGASAALLAMDEAQLRTGTVTALVRPGDRPASAVPVPPVVPEIRIAPFPRGETPSVDDARIARLRRDIGCTVGDVGGPDEYRAVPLDEGKTLILLACGSGAYNVTWMPFVASAGQDGRTEIAPALFDAQWAQADGGRAELINAEWDSGARTISELSLGRGIGDCGTRSLYGWDGQRFRLLRQSAMGECRGARDYITVWRTRVRGR
ncbi:DUF1176 domain-containing protein [Sphingosinicella sp. LHD-64]|uniref:DUF1176 domain-containing protein n=1 Tax=Sphingosinicella sp. LHD-64 TaxID=3072139 RepID=UPI00280DE801|nr:DUF1176 domain-containing protein [Sphingosinicella sp. LHD-64]MDQ8755831.1 DUF1176 domain-containing protein [Sphingosinicella sp. LHD-64]